MPFYRMNLRIAIVSDAVSKAEKEIKRRVVCTYLST
jgi:hypothetical protein